VLLEENDSSVDSSSVGKNTRYWIWSLLSAFFCHFQHLRRRRKQAIFLQLVYKQHPLEERSIFFSLAFLTLVRTLVLFLHSFWKLCLMPQTVNCSM